MATSEPGEMSVPEKNPPLVDKPVGKFDMHLHVRKLSQHTLDQLCLGYDIPSDLNLVLPSDDMTMCDIPDDKLGIYVQQIKLG